MSFLEQPPVDPRPDGRGADDLDGLLRAFFRAEMPDPWPSFRAPESARLILPLPVPARGGAARSRFALAASVALLVTGSALFTGKLPTDDPGTPRGGLDDRATDVHKPLRNRAEPPKQTPPGNYLIKEELIQKPDAGYIKVDVFELPATK